MCWEGGDLLSKSLHGQSRKSSRKGECALHSECPPFLISLPSSSLNNRDLWLLLRAQDGISACAAQRRQSALV